MESGAWRRALATHTFGLSIDFCQGHFYPPPPPTPLPWKRRHEEETSYLYHSARREIPHLYLVCWRNAFISVISCLFSATLDPPPPPPSEFLFLSWITERYWRPGHGLWPWNVGGNDNNMKPDPKKTLEMSPRWEAHSRASVSMAFLSADMFHIHKHHSLVYCEGHQHPPPNRTRKRKFNKKI